jgi:hypothetical protein
MNLSKKHKEDQARNIFNNRAPDDSGEEKETPAQMAARVRKRFHIQQSQKRDLARHKRQRGLKSKVGFEQ